MVHSDRTNRSYLNPEDYKNDEKNLRQLIFPAGGTGAEDEEDENSRVLEVRSECSSPGDLEEAQEAVNGVRNETGKVYEKCRGNLKVLEPDSPENHGCCGYSVYSCILF